MKTLTNKTCEGIKNEKGESLKYAEVGVICLQFIDQSQGQSGFTPAEMAARIRVQNKLEEGGESIKLEDTDAEKLNQCIQATKWMKLDKSILDFLDETRDELTKTIPANK
jgi:hypothetical protein